MTGFDPTYISSMEHFESLRHEEIYAKAQQIDAAQIVCAATTWLEVAAALTTSFPLTRAAVERVMNSMEWEGATADAAEAGTRGFAASIDELAAVLDQVGARLGGVAAAAEAVKVAVAPPGGTGPVGTIARILEAAQVIDAQMAREALRQEAVLAMNMIYKPAYTAAGTGVPALPAPPGTPSATPPSQPISPSGPAHPLPEPECPDIESDSETTHSAPYSPKSPAPQPNNPLPSAPAPQSPVPEPQAPAPEPPPQSRQAPPPTPTPAPSSPPPAQQLPESAPSTPPPAPDQAEPTVPLPDPGGQPGVTGPIEDNQHQPPTANQPGVIP
ncbi:hypothetical protein ACL02S_11175 [Nocardia sp. 004]|uniref:hypothetical protein n=1 Tax=Nocardia sp. 004 TaxID=3385978 RepID=UPI0039A08343